MDSLLIVIGILAGVAAIVFFIAAFSDENIIWLGVAAFCAIGAYFGLYTGVHHEFAKFHAKHVAILSDLRAQGFKLSSSDVFAVNGRYYGSSTEADLRLGKCLIPFIATNVNGVWHVALPSPNPSEIVVLTPRQVATFGHDCR